MNYCCLCCFFHFEAGTQVENVSLVWDNIPSHGREGKKRKHKHTHRVCDSSHLQPSSCLEVSNHPNNHIMTSLQSPAAVTRRDLALASMIRKKLWPFRNVMQKPCGLGEALLDTSNFCWCYAVLDHPEHIKMWKCFGYPNLLGSKSVRELKCSTSVHFWE